MYKVLLVDDEKIILNGISRIVDWEACGTVLAGTARNGLEAYERITENPPDILISDIRMPGLDGLELAAKVREAHPRIRIILLSGFSEFEYAKTAMQFGVKHYLLKPCNEAQIEEALRESVEELRETEGRERFVANLKHGLQKVMPHVKEQLLKEFVTNQAYGSGDWEYYRQLLDLNPCGGPVRLALFRVEEPFEFEHLFAVKNIAEELLPNPVLSSNVGAHVLILLEEPEDPEGLYGRIGDIRDTFRRYYKLDLTVALSEPGAMSGARQLYKETLECLNHRFYLGEGSLITVRDIVLPPAEHEGAELGLDADALVMAVRSGNTEDAERELERFFGRLSGLRSGIHTVKTYVIQAYTAVIRLARPEEMKRYIEKLVPLMELDTLQGMRKPFRETVGALTRQYYEENRTKHSAVIGKVLTIIEDHLGDPELSLNVVAKQMLYMNADYLGKLFRKETGEKFSNYVIKRRVAKAAERIAASRQDLKIFELAEELGFGDNPQYFSQVFKKVTGTTPSDYMKTPVPLPGLVGFLNKENGFLD